MDIFFIFLLSFLIWALLLGFPYIIAKKVNNRSPLLTMKMKHIVPPQAYIHNVFLYIIALFILVNLILQLKDSHSLLVFKALIVILLTAFSYQTLRLFRK